MTEQMNELEGLSVDSFCLISSQVLGHHLDFQQTRDLASPCLSVLIYKMGNNKIPTSRDFED